MKILQRQSTGKILNSSTTEHRPSTFPRISQLFLCVVVTFYSLCPLLADSAAKAKRQFVPIAGTQISLTQPDGFATAVDFPGFAQKATYSSVMVTTLPAPFAQTTAGFTQPMLAGRGITLLSRQAYPLNHAFGLLLHVKQTASGIIFEKWMYTFGDTKQTILVVATFPQELAQKLSTLLKTTVLSAHWDRTKTLDPYSDLRFHISAQPPLKFAERVGNTLVFTDSRQGATEPTIFGAGYALSDIGAVDQKQFALTRLAEEPVKEQTVLSTAPVVIDGLHGYENTAIGHDKKSKDPVTLYQVVLFAGKTYFLMFGITPTSKAAQTIPMFRLTAASLTRTGHIP